MSYNSVRPEIHQAFIDYGDLMTEQDFEFNFFPSVEEMLALRLSNNNSFARVTNWKEYQERKHKKIRATENYLDDETWWRIQNDLI